MRPISDDEMRELLTRSRAYTLVVLKAGVQYHDPGTPAIIREHGRRNFQLREAGLLSIVCPVTDTDEVRGIGIFNASVEDVKNIMDGDPGVQAGVFVYEIHPCRGFPGDSLPS